MISMMDRMNVNGHSQRGYDELPQHPLDRLKPLRTDKLLRRKTFDTWPETSAVKPEILLEDGFYYMGMNDKVQCVYCGGVLSGWQADDNVHLEHARHFSRCPSLDMADDIEADGVPGDLETDSVPYHPDSDSKDVLDDAPNDAHCLSQPHNFGNLNEKTDKVESVPKNQFKIYNPKYSLYSQRLETFKNWPNDHELKPSVLASTGLYYTGEGDKCQCYVCGGILAEWEAGDIPEDEHKNWFKNCPNNF